MSNMTAFVQHMVVEARLACALLQKIGKTFRPINWWAVSPPFCFPLSFIPYGTAPLTVSMRICSFWQLWLWALFVRRVDGDLQHLARVY